MRHFFHGALGCSAIVIGLFFLMLLLLGLYILASCGQAVNDYNQSVSSIALMFLRG